MHGLLIIVHTGPNWCRLRAFFQKRRTTSHMDEADVAQIEIELRERAMRNPQSIELAAIGECHNCSEKLAPTQKFCDPDCEADFRKRQWHVRQRHTPIVNI